MTSQQITKRRSPPPFSSASARAAQPLAIKARRALDGRLRQELADRLPAIGRQLRLELVSALRIRCVERFVVAARRGGRK